FPIHAGDVVESIILWMNLIVPAVLHEILRCNEMPVEPVASVFVRADPRLLQFAADLFTECRVFRSADCIQLWIDPCAFKRGRPVLLWRYKFVTVQQHWQLLRI